jgi:hypothetical protein
VTAGQETTENWREIVVFFGAEQVGALIEPSARDGAIVRVTSLGYYLGTDSQTFPLS